MTNALVVKLVDTKDLKFLPFWECQLKIEILMKNNLTIY